MRQQTQRVFENVSVTFSRLDLCTYKEHLKGSKIRIEKSSKNVGFQKAFNFMVLS